MVLEYMLKNIGPAHDPCGTEKGKVLMLEYSKAAYDFIN